MRTYIIPPAIKTQEKEKIIGGVLDITQAFWLMLSVVVAILVFFLLSPINKIFAGIVAVVIAIALAVTFGFLKIKGYTVLKYIKYKKAFNKKRKALPNKRKI